MVHNEKFRIEIKENGGKTTVLMNGIIDEDTTFSEIAKAKGAVEINFKGVSSINSCGVRNWVNFMKEMTGRQISYVECPPIIVRQMNMVPSFSGKAEVASVYITYVCDECDEEKMVLLPKSKFSERSLFDQTFTCESCKEGAMEFDGHPDQYFAFTKS